MEFSIDEFREECRQLAIRDRHHELLELMEKASLDAIQAEPDLAFWRALGLLTTVQYREGKIATEYFLQNYANSGDPLSEGRGHMLRSHLLIMDGDTEASYEHELKVVAILPEDAYHERLRSWATIDTMAGHIGDTARVEQAAEALADVRNHLPLDQSWWYSFVVPNRADILAKRGLIDKAEALLRAQLPTMPAEGAEVFRVRLAVMALEQMDPDLASSLLEEVAYDGPTEYWSLEAMLVASEVARLKGEPERALQILQDGMAERSRNEVRAELNRAQLQLATLWIQEGEVDLADSWLRLASRALDPWPRTFGHPMPNLIRAELELAKGNTKLALDLLEALRDEGLRRKHTGLLVGIYAHLAFAWASINESEKAAENVQLAKQAGQDGKFARSFMVMGQDVRSSVGHVPVTPHETVPDNSGDKPVLSFRETEVISMVADGKRNAEIAENLFLSVSTVKNHLANIYRRLGVTNRNAAVRAARELGLLTPRGTKIS